jgi:hypothetical protein
MKARQRYRVKVGAATFYILSLEQGAAFNELCELIGVDRDDLEKLGAVAKVEALVQGATAFDESFEEISYERGLEVMRA